MARDLARRIGALEEGNGTIGIGEVLDALDQPGIDLRDARTCPQGWQGRTIDPALVRALDGISSEEVTQRLRCLRDQG